MAAPKRRGPPPRDAGNGPLNATLGGLQNLHSTSEPSPAIGIYVETMRRFDIGVDSIDLIDIIDELHLIYAGAVAARLAFRSRDFELKDKRVRLATEELLTTVEDKIEALYERLNADLDARRREGGAAA